MIPKICANCQEAGNVVDSEGRILTVICRMLPIGVEKPPGDRCGSFKMSDSPMVEMPDEPQATLEPEAGEGEEDE